MIDRKAVPDSMVWTYPSAMIDDPRPAAGSFSMADVHHLSVHVIKLRDMPKGVLVLSSAEVQEEPHHDIRPTLQRLPFYCTPPAAADAVIPDPTPEDLVVGTPSAKILAKAKAFQKRKTSTSDDFDNESGDDDDAYVQIPLVTPICSAVVIPSSGNQGGSSAAPAAEGPSTRDSQGKGIMVDDAAAPSVGASRPRPSSSPAPSFKDVSRDAIHTDFFSFSVGPYYDAYPEGGVVGNCDFTHEEWDAPYRPTFRVLTRKSLRLLLFLTTKMSVLHCMMMSHGGEIFARYRGLLQSHHEYVLSTDSRLKVMRRGDSLTQFKLQKVFSP
ncbi:hypothetical protein Tco_0881322 [Tanacetum coccineum]